MDNNYRQYSLNQLETWIHDAMSAAEATPQEIYDVIRGVVEENYYTYKHQTSQAYELLCLLNGNGKGHIKAYDDAIDKVLSCDKDDQSPKCKNAWTSFWEQEEVKSSIQGSGENGDGFYIPKDKVVKWQLPVEKHLSGEYFVIFPDDLLEAADLREGDTVEWIPNGSGSYTLRKVNSCEDKK